MKRRKAGKRSHWSSVKYFVHYCLSLLTERCTLRPSYLLKKKLEFGEQTRVGDGRRRAPLRYIIETAVTTNIEIHWYIFQSSCSYKFSIEWAPSGHQFFMMFSMVLCPQYNTWNLIYEFSGRSGMFWALWLFEFTWSKYKRSPYALQTAVAHESCWIFKSVRSPVQRRGSSAPSIPRPY